MSIVLSSVVFAQLVKEKSSSRQKNCLTFMIDGNFEWMWMESGTNVVESGTAEFYHNKSMITWDQQGKILNSGTYEVTSDEESGWCYNKEVYDYPEKQIVCKTFSVDDFTNSLVGCLNENSCFHRCESNMEWSTWSSARLRYRIH